MNAQESPAVVLFIGAFKHKLKFFLVRVSSNMHKNYNAWMLFCAETALMMRLREDDWLIEGICK
jgi:hypothetical protein